MWSKLKASPNGWIVVLITAPAVAGLVIAVKLTGFFQLLEWATYDQFFRLRSPEPVDYRLLIVTVDESDIDHVKHWPLSDATLAQLIKRLNQYQPAAIGLDIYRDLPVEPGHQRWLEVMKSTPNLIGVEKAVGKTVNPPSTLSKLNRVALADLVVDADGKVRRALLSYRSPEGQLRFGLGTQLALMYLEERGITLKVIDQTQKHYRLGQAVFVPFSGNDGGYVRTNAGGYQILLNYRGQLKRFRTVSLTQVLENKVKPELIRDRIVLIGSIAPSLNDKLYTPYSSSFINTPQATPGIVIHANVTSQIVSAALVGRPLIRTLTKPFDWLWILVWSGIGATLHWGFLEIDQRRQKIATRWKVLGIYIFLTGGILIAGSYFAFLAGWWIPIVSPLVALLGSAIAISGNQILKLQQQRSELALHNFRMEQAKIKAEAASQAKGQFLAKMSHELRTPLNAILGFTQLMRRDASLSKDQREYLDIIMRSGEHLLALINDVLEISKIEAGRITFTENSFDLYHLMDTLKEMFQLKAQTKGLKLIFERTNDVPQYVLTDEGKLRQILINLLGNAIKFTEKGSVTLTVERSQKLDAHELGTQQKNENLSYPVSRPQTPVPIFKLEESMLNSELCLCFSVHDTGPGIAPEEIDILFEAFSQTSTGKKSSEGTGLGLAISHQFVQLMGGEIAVSSNLDRGTMFKFDIPIKLGQPHGIQTDDATGQVIGLAPNQEEYRILVVEDNWANRQLLLKLLLSVGFQVREAENGQEGITLWSTWEPHLILMDMQMPVMDGYEATKQIKSHEKGQATTIIAFTASAFAEQRTNILAAGCDDFVSKPLREEVLWSKIAQHLGVNYIYEKLEPPTSFPSGEKFEVLTEESLSVMPREWRQELYMAAAACNEDELFSLIEQIPQPHATLKSTLADLVNNFRIDLILDLSQEFANEEPFNS